MIESTKSFRRWTRHKTAISVVVLVVVVFGLRTLVANRENQESQTAVSTTTERHAQLPEAEDVTNDGHSERQWPRTNDVNPAFRTVSDDIVLRVTPRMNEKFFPNGTPATYKRHRVLQIDAQALRDQIEKSYLGRADEVTQQLVQIPLFDDFSVAVKINGWMESGNGLASAYGQIIVMDTPTASAKFHISDAGRIEATLKNKDDVFVISDVGDFTYYMVLQMERSSVID